jgi:hypothetical protein
MHAHTLSNSITTLFITLSYSKQIQTALYSTKTNITSSTPSHYTPSNTSLFHTYNTYFLHFHHNKFTLLPDNVKLLLLTLPHITHYCLSLHLHHIVSFHIYSSLYTTMQVPPTTLSHYNTFPSHLFHHHCSRPKYCPRHNNSICTIENQENPLICQRLDTSIIALTGNDCFGIYSMAQTLTSPPLKTPPKYAIPGK